MSVDTYDAFIYNLNTFINTQSNEGLLDMYETSRFVKIHMETLYKILTVVTLI